MEGGREAGRGRWEINFHLILSWSLGRQLSVFLITEKQYSLAEV
jgi:hypothetical protein